MKSRRLTIFWSLMTVLLASLAGCTDPDDGDDDGADDGGGDQPAPPTYDPAPKGTALTTTDFAAIAAVFNDEPLTGGQQPWPSHAIKWVSNETFVLMHFDAESPIDASRVLWVGIGTKGVFCAQDQPGPEFTHFHKREAATYEAGHGGDPGTPGYWLVHIWVNQDASPFGTTGPQVDYNFGPTEPPMCETVPPADFEPADADGLDTLERAGLVALFDDEPLRGGQEPWPSHAIKWLNEEVFMLTHWDAQDPSDADQLLWMGIGVRGDFCAADQPTTDFTHHHVSHAATYDAGHGGQPGQPGYWLIHVAVRDFESPFGATGGPGVHHEFGPTPPPMC